MCFALCLCVASVGLYLYRSSEHTPVYEGVGSASDDGSDLQARVCGELLRGMRWKVGVRFSTAVRSVGAPIEVVPDIAEDGAVEERAAPEGYSLVASADAMTKGRLRADERKPLAEAGSHNGIGSVLRGRFTRWRGWRRKRSGTGRLAGSS